MKVFPFKQMVAVVGVFGLLADSALASPEPPATTQTPAAALTPAATQTPTSAQATAAATQTIVVAPALVASTPQPYAPIGGTFAPTLTGGFYAAPLAGWLGLGPPGGALYPSSIGGTMNWQFPPGGTMNNRVNNTIVTGGITPGFPSGGVLGSNGVGGFRSPSNSLSAVPGSVIILGGAQSNGVASGGAQPVGAVPGGVIVTGGSPPGGVQPAGSPPGGVQSAGTPAGGVIVTGGAPK
jgi:hypothetical protein